MSYQLKLGLALGVLALALLGCGGGGSEQGSGSSGEAETSLVDGPSAEFVIPGGDNTIQYFGREGSKAEREEASDVVEAWDSARAAKDWSADCRYLSRSYRDVVVADAEATSKGEATGCVQALEFFGALASGTAGPTTTGPIDSLRVSGGIGYAQYHGRHGVDWIVPLKKEDGEWRVEVTAPVSRRK